MALRVGIQLYSVRENMKKDPVGTIGKVAEIGYKYLETANLNGLEDFGSGFGATAPSLKESISEFGSSVISAHVYPMDEKNIDRVLEYYAYLDTRYIHSKPVYGTVEDVKKEAEVLNKLGQKCKAAGMQHMIHTGLPVYCEDGSLCLDRIIEFTSGDTVMFELDTYWMLRAGLDPIDGIKKYAERILLIHQKDMPKDFHGVANLNTRMTPGDKAVPSFFDANIHSDEFCEIGTGCMDPQTTIDAAVNYTKATHIILEQDFTKMDEFDSIRLSMENLKKCSNLIFD